MIVNQNKAYRNNISYCFRLNLEPIKASRNMLYIHSRRCNISCKNLTKTRQNIEENRIKYNDGTVYGNNT